MENYLDSTFSRIFNLVSESISGYNHSNYCDSIADLWILHLQKNREIMVYLELLYVFFKIGLLGFGGGYAMISLIQFEVVDNFHWLTLFAPIQHPSPIVIIELHHSPARRLMSPILCVPVKNVTSGPISTLLPILTNPFPLTTKLVPTQQLSPISNFPVHIIGATIAVLFPII